MCLCESLSVMSDSCDPMDCSLPGSSVHRIPQTRILEWVAVPFSMGSSQPRDQTQVSCIAARFFTSWATREALILKTDSWNNDDIHLPFIESYIAELYSVDIFRALRNNRYFKFSTTCLEKNNNAINYKNIIC